VVSMITRILPQIASRAWLALGGLSLSRQGHTITALCWNRTRDSSPVTPRHLFALAVATNRKKLEQTEFWQAAGRPGSRSYTLKSEKLEAQVSSYGAALIVLRVPDRSGNWEDIIIGPQDLSSHVADHRSKGPIFFGALIGRYANRIAHGNSRSMERATPCEQ